MDTAKTTFSLTSLPNFIQANLRLCSHSLSSLVSTPESFYPCYFVRCYVHASSILYKLTITFEETYLNRDIAGVAGRKATIPLQTWPYRALDPNSSAFHHSDFLNMEKMAVKIPQLILLIRSIERLGVSIIILQCNFFNYNNNNLLLHHLLSFI